jgi:LytS/YehU family sensor histidine kinase
MRDLAKIFAINVGIATTLVLIAAAYMRNPRLERLFWPFFISMTYSSFIGVLAWWVLPNLAPKFSPNAAKRWLTLILLLSGISLVGGTMAYTVMILNPFMPIRIEYGQSMWTCLLITQVIGGISFVVESTKQKAQETTLQLRTKELESEKALKAASEAKLQSLESRVHPHFLFNTLNSISSLVRSNPAEAEAMIEKLAALLRFSLDRHGKLVCLADEIQITQSYLEIEKARFTDRLRYEFQIPPELLGAQVPAMSIQTLVENSVKYAVGVQRQGADILIRARLVNNQIELEVHDTGPGFSPDSLPAGHGLDTLQQRLSSIYGEAATLTTRKLDPGMEVAFRVPC